MLFFLIPPTPWDRLLRIANIYKQPNKIMFTGLSFNLSIHKQQIVYCLTCQLPLLLDFHITCFKTSFSSNKWSYKLEGNIELIFYKCFFFLLQFSISLSFTGWLTFEEKTKHAYLKFMVWIVFFLGCNFTKIKNKSKKIYIQWYSIMTIFLFDANDNHFKRKIS